MLGEEAGIEAGILKGQETSAFLEMRGLPGGRHHARSLHREASSASSLRLQHPSLPQEERKRSFALHALVFAEHIDSTNTVECRGRTGLAPKVSYLHTPWAWLLGQGWGP